MWGRGGSRRQPGLKIRPPQHPDHSANIRHHSTNIRTTAPVAPGSSDPGGSYTTDPCRSSPTISCCTAPRRAGSITSMPAGSRFSTITATCRRPTSPATGASPTCSRSGSREIITSGARCAPTVCRNASAPATPRPTRSSSPGPPPCRGVCAIRCITGRTSSCSAISASTICSTSSRRRRSGRRPTIGCARTS